MNFYEASPTPHQKKTPTIMLRKIIPFRNIYNEFAVLISINDNNSGIIIYFITIFHNNITNIIYFCIFLVAKHFFFLSNIWYPISSVINWEAIFNFYTSSCKIEFKTSIFTFFILNIFLCNISYIYSGVPEFICLPWLNLFKSFSMFFPSRSNRLWL